MSITIPESVTEIEEDAFAYCSSLTSINIPNSVISIGIGAFHGCRSLETISLPDSLKSISYGLFEDCRQLETLIIPGSIEKIMQFYYNPGLNNTGEPSNYTFSNCENLTNLYILNSPESLSVGCFAKIYHVSDGTLWTTDEYRSSGWEDWTNSIKLLSIDRALKNEINIVENLERLELGESITHVEVDISRSKKLSTIKCNALVPPELPEVSNAQYMNVNVYVPEESLEAYKADPVWGKFWNLQANGIEEVKIDSKRKVIGMYDMNGRGVSEDYQGLVIVRFSDGTCKKMFNHHD